MNIVVVDSSFDETVKVATASFTYAWVSCSCHHVCCNGHFYCYFNPHVVFFYSIFLSSLLLVRVCAQPWGPMIPHSIVLHRSLIWTRCAGSRISGILIATWYSQNHWAWWYIQYFESQWRFTYTIEKLLKKWSHWEKLHRVQDPIALLQSGAWPSSLLWTCN